ncbi:N-formylglutamate amidohydrolase [Pseudooceanicola sp.]|uniref:N-formylglutamate amidohydrolase n=1 Tax=Pseudooceanicola sp. TaxID=1914328 RepID=UPI0035C691A9
MQDSHPPFQITRPEGRGLVVFACEHASKAIPAEFDDLGLTGAALSSHVAWDIGAMDLALALSEIFDAPLVAGGVSRLVYDLNRPLEAASAIPETSEIFDIPGNTSLSASARQARFDSYHQPYHTALSDVLEARADAEIALVTIHSFTPVFHGKTREVEIGFLHDDGAEFAKAALAAEEDAGRFRAALNEPYSAQDGVTYTLRKHGEARGLPTLMIEVRNDLIDTPEAAREMAVHLSGTLQKALQAMGRVAEVTR